MKNIGFIKRIGAMFLSATLVATMVPSISAPVFAQSVANELPSKTQFATAEELKTFDTNDNDGAKNSARIYFGGDSQQWWIAGSQNSYGVTLFAASPLATGQCFEPDSSKDKNLDFSWECMYSRGNPKDVYPNHYGASPLRKTLKELETSYFTDAEQGFMMDTRIYTNDTKCDWVYSTDNKLYLAYGNRVDDKYITVGENIESNDCDITVLNDALRVDRAYWENIDEFWLRAPEGGSEYRNIALMATPYGTVQTSEDVNNKKNLVPAFELNVSSVLFGSAAPAASATGDLTLQNTVADGAFTLRYDASQHNKNLGSALVSLDKKQVTLSNVPKNTYLVVQNSAKAKARKITTETVVTASDMGLDSFSNCKVWLEKTDSANRMTYATMGSDINENTVALVGNKQYSSLKAAFEGRKDGDTVVLLQDTASNGIIIDAEINFDLNGKAVNFGSNKIVINQYAILNIINNNNGDILNGYILNSGILTTDGSISCNVHNYADGTIENGKYLGTIYNYGNLNNGDYLGTIENGWAINGGRYLGNVKMLPGCNINGGTFDENSVVTGFGTINGGDFYSQVTIKSLLEMPPIISAIYGGNFAKEPILTDEAVYGEGKVLSVTNNSKLPYKVIDSVNALKLDITLDQNLTLESGNLKQISEKNSEIQPIIINVGKGYYLSDDFASELKAKGLSVTKEGNKLTISGTLNDNLTIALEATKKLSINHAPTINASDKTITVGDSFDPLKEVTAKDYEDGDKVKLEVIKNTVDTKKAGTYEVVYKATDSAGAKTTKTITVTVKANANADVNVNTPNTGDQAKLGIFAGLLVISALAIVALSLINKKKKLNK